MEKLTALNEKIKWLPLMFLPTFAALVGLIAFSGKQPPDEEAIRNN